MAIMLEPIIPTSCDTMLTLIGADESMRTFDSIHQDKRLTPGTPVGKPVPIFPKIEREDEVLKKKVKS